MKSFTTPTFSFGKEPLLTRLKSSQSSFLFYFFTFQENKESLTHYLHSGLILPYINLQIIALHPLYNTVLQFFRGISSPSTTPSHIPFIT